MAFTIEIVSFSRTSDTSFEASGTLGEKPFAAQTILWKGEPIFKVQEADDEGGVAHRKMANSTFSRGERIALARSLKLRRLAHEEAETTVSPEVELAKLNLKQLRTRAKELGVSGTHRKGITKPEVVALVAQA
jgi:hypothetical protein